MPIEDKVRDVPAGGVSNSFIRMGLRGMDEPSGMGEVAQAVADGNSARGGKSSAFLDSGLVISRPVGWVSGGKPSTAHQPLNSVSAEFRTHGRNLPERLNRRAGFITVPNIAGNSDRRRTRIP